MVLFGYGIPYLKEPLYGIDSDKPWLGRSPDVTLYLLRAYEVFTLLLCGPDLVSG